MITKVTKYGKGYEPPQGLEVNKVNGKKYVPCMFQSVMRSNKKVLTGLLCALLHMKSEEIHSVTILNPFEYGKTIRSKPAQ